MERFLEKVAHRILVETEHSNLHTAVIVPNRRSTVFLKKYLVDLAGKNYWLPSFFSTDEFITNVSGMHKADPFATYLELFRIHKELAGNTPRTLDDFLVWAPIMMADFNDVGHLLETYLDLARGLDRGQDLFAACDIHDPYLVPGPAVFKDLSQGAYPDYLVLCNDPYPAPLYHGRR